MSKTFSCTALPRERLIKRTAFIISIVLPIELVYISLQLISKELLLFFFNVAMWMFSVKYNYYFFITEDLVKPVCSILHFIREKWDIWSDMRNEKMFHFFIVKTIGIALTSCRFVKLFFIFWLLSFILIGNILRL